MEGLTESQKTALELFQEKTKQVETAVEEHFRFLHSAQGNTILPYCRQIASSLQKNVVEVKRHHQQLILFYACLVRSCLLQRSTTYSE